MRFGQKKETEERKREEGCKDLDVRQGICKGDPGLYGSFGPGTLFL